MKKVPFLVVGMKHDIFLGYKWFEKHGVNLDFRNERFEYLNNESRPNTNDDPMNENGYLCRNPEFNSCTKSEKILKKRDLTNKVGMYFMCPKN